MSYFPFRTGISSYTGVARCKFHHLNSRFSMDPSRTLLVKPAEWSLLPFAFNNFQPRVHLKISSANSHLHACPPFTHSLTRSLARPPPKLDYRCYICSSTWHECLLDFDFPRYLNTRKEHAWTTKRHSQARGETNTLRER